MVIMFVLPDGQILPSGPYQSMIFNPHRYYGVWISAITSYWQQKPKKGQPLRNFSKNDCTHLSKALFITLSEDSILKSSQGIGSGGELPGQYIHLTFSSPCFLTPFFNTIPLYFIYHIPLLSPAFKEPSQQMVRTRSRCPQRIKSKLLLSTPM